MPKCIVKRDAKGRFAGCMPGTGGGSGGGGGGKKSGSSGSLAGGLPDKVDDLQAIAKKEGIDINTLSYKARKSVLAAAINAKRAGKDLREEGLLKSTKSKAKSKTKPPAPVAKRSRFEAVDDKKQINKKFKEWDKQQESFGDVGLYFSTRDAIAKSQTLLKKAKAESGDAAQIRTISAALDRNTKNIATLEAGFSPEVRKFVDRPDAKLLRERAKAGEWVANEARSDRNPKLGIVDEAGNLQALASYRHKASTGFVVEYLATAPWNVTQTDKRTVKGAGTQAIAAAVEKSNALGYKGAMTLAPLDNAVPFYKKLGFTQDAATGEMSLSSKDAQSLLKKLGK